MSLLIRKFEKYEFRNKKIQFLELKGVTEFDLDYISTLFLRWNIDFIIERLHVGAQDERTLFNVDEKMVDITDILNSDLDEIDYSLDRNDFIAAIKNIKSIYDRGLSGFYLLLAGNNRVLVQENLDGIIFTNTYISYVREARKVPYLSEQSDYSLSFLSAFSLSDSFSDFYKIFQEKSKEVKQDFLYQIGQLFVKQEGERIIFGRKYDDKTFVMSLQNFKEMLDKWDYYVQKGVDDVYFIWGNERIDVKDRLYPVKKMVLLSPQCGSYQIESEYNIERLDVFRSFVVEFNPEAFLLRESETVISYETIDISWSLESERATVELNRNSIWRYKDYTKRKEGCSGEASSFSLSLSQLEGLAHYYIQLKQKKAPEIYFVQKDDGSIAIQENLERC